MTTDKRFREVVQTGKSIGYGDTRGYQALCGECGHYQEVRVNEFIYPVLIDTEEMKYTAEMRAWNCCKQGEEPIDGFPPEPDKRHRSG